MEREPTTAEPSSLLESVAEMLQSSRGMPVFLVDESGLVGIVTSEKLSELIELDRVSGE